MSSFYEMTADQVKTGIEISRKNARRLGSDASILLAHGASAASVYGQWHLAIEELGKSSILTESASKVAPGGSVQVPVRIFQGAHKEKFSAGLALMPHTRGSGLGFSLKVNQNVSGTTKTFVAPYGGRAMVLVGPFQTGQFDDTSSGIEPSHELRLRLLYVDFDGTDWWEPEAELRSVGILAKNSISESDLHAAIDELLRVVS
jgi:AbiV family abortive infection protein